MKKIGLILANPITNYGAHLQAFATQKVVDSMGVETSILDFSRMRVHEDYRLDIGVIVYCCKLLTTRLLSKIDRSVYDKAFYQNQESRIKEAKAFREKYLHDVIYYSDYKELKRDASQYYGIMIGSDQMWLPGSSFSPLNSLRFVPAGVKRLSYATSLGVEKYPKYCWRSARIMWKQMDSVSVREQQGVDIIKQVCNNKVKAELVVDPTYLLSKSQWEELIPKKCMSYEKYVFCYFLGDDEESKLCAKKYAKAHGLKLVSILSCESMGSIDRYFADKTLGAVSPEDFINWIRGAECVFTDSFHGVAFSVINERQFFVFYRKRKDSNLSRNSRIDNILNTWQIKGRLILDTDLDWGKDVAKPIDYDTVNEILVNRRAQSLNYLKKALDIYGD